MDIKKRLEQISTINEKILEIKEKTNDIDYLNLYKMGNHPHEIGLLENIDDLNKFAVKIMQNVDFEKIKSAEDFFNRLKDKVSEYEESHTLNCRTLQQLFIDKESMIEDFKKDFNNSKLDNLFSNFSNNQSNSNFKSLYVFNTSNLNNLKTHKIFNAINELNKDHGNLFKFEVVQNPNSNFTRNNIVVLFHGNIELLAETIKKSNNPEIKYLKSICNSEMKKHFTSPLNENIFLIEDKIVKLNDLDAATFNSIYPDSKKVKNKLKI